MKEDMNDPLFDMTNLDGERNLCVANGVPLTIHGADRDAPEAWIIPGQLRNVTSNLKEQTNNKDKQDLIVNANLTWPS